MDTRAPAADTHRSVLLQEAVDGVLASPEGVYMDLTFGRGGHTQALLERLAPTARLIAFDRDAAAIEAARDLHDPRLQLVHRPFSDLAAVHAELGLPPLDGIMADLGVSSPQLDVAERGFSFLRDGPLDMRMDPSSGESAAEWLGHQTVDSLTAVLADFGEERHARAVAQAICDRIEQAEKGEAEPILRTLQLAELVAAVVRRRSRGASSGIHPATRTFQAVRIAVNQELDELDAVLSAAPCLLKEGGRLAIISFHSLEDRRVKKAFRPADARLPERPRGMGARQFALLAAAQQSQPAAAPIPQLREIGRVMPTDGESDANPRARSAVLRVAVCETPGEATE